MTLGREEAPKSVLAREGCEEAKGQNRGPEEGRMLPGCGIHEGMVSMATGEAAGQRKALWETLEWLYLIQGGAGGKRRFPGELHSGCSPSSPGAQI